MTDMQFLGRVYWQNKMDRFKESRDKITEEQTGAGARAIEKDRQLRARQKRYAQVNLYIHDIYTHACLNSAVVVCTCMQTNAIQRIRMPTHVAT
jgi:hypothetical protein